MGDARVHYYIDEVDCWQLLREDEVGWHAGDGRGNGNETTLGMEIIMDGSGSAADKNAEERGARLAAILLHRHGLSIDKLVTHQKWSGKYCPAYILPHWSTFKSKVKKYLQEISKPTTTATPKYDGKVSGYNIVRAANCLVIYNKGKNANTNKWGTEVAVDANGVATCKPVYGVGKMAIPVGGYVISGHGVASTWISSNIKKGSKITITNGVVKVGEVVSSTPTNASTTLVDGAKLSLVQVPLYASSSAKIKASTKTGTYYIWDEAVINNRVCITNTSANVGKKGMVTGWINVSDAKKSLASTAPSSNKKIAKGSTVRLKQGAKTYTGGNLSSFVYNRNHIVKEISGDKAVITYGGVVVAAVKVSDLTLV